MLVSIDNPCFGKIMMWLNTVRRILRKFYASIWISGCSQV